jgi:hypothetical protein
MAMRRTTRIVKTGKFEYRTLVKIIKLKSAMPTEIENNDEDVAKGYNQYIDERKLLIGAAREGARTFDKAILTLASGSFGLSIGFLKDIVQKPFANTMWLLGASWALFAASIVIILLSFIAGQKACEQRIRYAYLTLVEKKKTDKSYWSIIAEIMNYLSIILFAAAIIYYSYFVYWNTINKP